MSPLARRAAAAALVLGALAGAGPDPLHHPLHHPLLSGGYPGWYLGGYPAAAATLEQARRSGSLQLCANPAALPYSNRHHQDGPPGFQVEIAEAVAREMGLGLQVDWIWTRRSAGRVDCDLLMDSIVTSADSGPGTPTGPAGLVREGPRLTLTKPYAGGGVVLVVPAGSPARRFDDLKGVKVGVVAGTITHQWLQAKGLTTSSFVYQDDIVDAVARAEIGAGAVAAPYVGWYRKAHPEARVEIPEGFVFEPELTWNVAIGLRRPDDGLVQAINAALDRLLVNHTIEAIYARYGVAYQPPFPAR